ncbi:hypothetical protein MEQU1_003338 [Malassezia equina]|uniref:HORMA domain-containing protein n=1 Tax=Malassezia equina TaxID=1381935 RepID=A0AAF0EHD1_9BASI|nr:hypothetical protein MEQU1_003338 [Malassezia equina]
MASHAEMPEDVRDRVQDGPMTYNVECAIHTILAVRQVYPQDLFVRCKAYDVPVYKSRHPGLTEYIAQAVRAIKHELEESAANQAVVALNYEDAPDAPDALERYVFSFQLLRSDTDKRDRDLVIRGNLSPAAADMVARQYLLQLLTLESRLLPLNMDRPLTFRILLETLEGRVPSGGKDVPNKLDTSKAVLSTTGPVKRDTTANVLHPLKTLESGVINTAEPPASLQRDLDDPAIADGVSPSGVPWHKRTLYTQASDYGESMSDDASDMEDM